MVIHIRWRGFVATIGGAAAWPLAACAQQPPMPMIGRISIAVVDMSVAAAAVRLLLPRGACYELTN
jgi:hypothetical protein